MSLTSEDKLNAPVRKWRVVLLNKEVLEKSACHAGVENNGSLKLYNTYSYGGRPFTGITLRDTVCIFGPNAWGSVEEVKE
jgi:hypothetical protein